MTLYIKKLWSLNPTKYKFIPLKKALEEYHIYVQFCKTGIKTFEQWRTTEI